MPRPRGLGVGQRDDMTPPRRDDALERHTSMENRINLPFHLPVQNFAQAHADEQQRKEARRLEREANGGLRMPYHEYSERECNNHAAMDQYRHHVTDRRGAQTQKKGNLIVRD